MSQIRYESDARPQPDELIELYRSVGWGAYTTQPENFGPMIENASLVIAARDGDDLVGLVRVVGDGATIAYIQDLLVRPTHQGRGIGAELLRQALAATEHVRQTLLMTDAGPENEHVVRLYRRLGFQTMGEEGCVGLALFR